jgi:hypothetical protein
MGNYQLAAHARCGRHPPACHRVNSESRPAYEEPRAHVSCVVDTGTTRQVGPSCRTFLEDCSPLDTVLVRPMQALTGRADARIVSPSVLAFIYYSHISSALVKRDGGMSFWCPTKLVLRIIVHVYFVAGLCKCQPVSHQGLTFKQCKLRMLLLARY